MVERLSQDAAAFFLIGNFVKKIKKQVQLLETNRTLLKTDHARMLDKKCCRSVRCSSLSMETSSSLSLSILSKPSR